MATYDSLTAPLDRRDGVVRHSLAPPLTEEQTARAMETKFRSLEFPEIDRHYADPPIIHQKIGLVSFTPSKNARPDEDGIYGMMKLRGNFATEEEANERAEFLIRNHDSYHEIYHAFVGRPFPVTNKDGFEKELQTIDIRKKTVRLISEDILNKKREEEKEVKEMHEREKTLLEESKRAKENLPEDPYDRYITDQVKRAQLIWTYHETMKKCEQMKDLIRTTNETIAMTEADCPSFRDQYKEKYMKARKDAGLTEENEEDSFIKYLGMDLISDEDKIDS